MFGGGNGLTGSGDRGLQAEEELIFSTKEGQTVLATRNASLLSCYSGLFDYAVRHNVDVTKSTSMGECEHRCQAAFRHSTETSILNRFQKVTRYQIARNHYHNQQSAVEFPLRARATHRPLKKKLESVVKIKRYPKPLQLEVYSRVQGHAGSDQCGSEIAPDV